MAIRRITILAPLGEGNNLSSIAGAYKILLRAGQYWETSGKGPAHKVEVAGSSTQVDYYGGLFCVKPHINISEVHATDLVIVPSLNHDYHSAVANNGAMIDWIARKYSEGAEMASICTGAFLLAAAGVLEGRVCSTHWSAADAFRRLHPRVALQTDQLITDQLGVYTNGGAYSFLHLIIYLVEKYYDRTTAIYCAKVFQIDLKRNSQAEFIIFSGQKTHDDGVIREAQEMIETRLNEKISIEDLSARFAVGRRNFDRRFIKATGNTPVEYAQRVKVEAAKKALENTRKTISEVMYDVGYADVKAFREVFRKVTGMSPLAYKNKYTKNVI